MKQECDCKAFKDGITSGSIEYDKEGKGYSVVGCCMQCYVLCDMEYCPFCGKKLEHPEE